LRPGRIDRKVQYNLATQAQADALFLRFYPESTLELDLAQSAKADDDSTSEKKQSQDIPTCLRTLASQFSSAIPPHEFSTAELQGYLLGCKTSPCQAAAGVAAWVKSETAERQEKRRKDEGKRQEKAKAAAEKEAEKANRYGPGMFPNPGMGIAPQMGMYPMGPVNSNTVSSPLASPSTAVTPVIPAVSTVPEALPLVGDPVVDTPPEQAIDGLDTPAIVPIQKPLINGVY
jgi:chaperone BCS1